MQFEKLVCASVAAACVAMPAAAQYSSGFETDDAVAASPDGLDLNGQDTFYNPLPDESVSALAFTYQNNAVGLPANPTGDAQFVAGIGPAGSVYARSQRDVTYSAPGVWSVCFDVAATFGGTLPAAQNIGSFSTQPFPGAATYIALARWVDPATADAWNADYVWFNAAGTQLTEQVPDPGFQNLMTNHWYRWCTVFDFETNVIVQVSITDLTTGVTVSHEPVDRYLLGGSNGSSTPTGFRLFAGAAAVSGNTLAFDNLDIQPTEPPCPADCNADGQLNILDFVCFQGEFGDQTPFGDCDDNAQYNILDFICYQGLFSKGCP